MGTHRNITYDKFPEQGGWLGRRVKACYHYDTSKSHAGIIVRDDRDEPGKTIIKLDNGRYLLAEECHFSLEPIK